MALAQRARWAKIKGEIAPPPATVKPKRRISAEGMKRIIAATKKRWRLQRAVVKAPSTRAVKKVAPVTRSAVKKAIPAPTTAPDQIQAAG